VSPIRPENRALYPADWPLISRRIRDRARQRCERCGVPNYAVGHRDATGAFVRAAGNGPLDAAGDGKVWRSLEPLTFTAATEIAATLNYGDDEGLHWIVVVLTVAHLNHDPADCRDENLEALCQRCHNRHDAATRRAGIVARRREANRDLLAAADAAEVSSS
jgi:hypothetical protein